MIIQYLLQEFCQEYFFSSLNSFYYINVRNFFYVYQKFSQEFLQNAKKSKNFFGIMHVFSWFFKNYVKFYLFFWQKMIRQKTQNFDVKSMLTYCLENFYIDDFRCYSLCYYLGFQLFLINRHATISFLKD